MGEFDQTRSLELQATALAEKTVAAPLEDLAQLCPPAEDIIEGVAVGKDPDRNVLADLGLRDFKELRAFLETVILKTAASPQDILASYLFQGKAARNAGIDPRGWIFQVHRPLRLAIMKLLHSYESQGEIPDSTLRNYGLDHPIVAEKFRNALESKPPIRSDDLNEQMFQKRLDRHSMLAGILRTGGAVRMLQAQIEQMSNPNHVNGSGRHADKGEVEQSAEKKSARIPLSRLFMKESA